MAGSTRRRGDAQVLSRSDHFALPLPPGHGFALAKYARLRERVEARVPDLPPAHRDFGTGLCAFNDAAVAAPTLLAEGAIARAVIIDLDVQQGDAADCAYLAALQRMLDWSLAGAGSS